MHWCIDEQLMLMSALPFLGLFIRRIHLWYHSKFNHKSHCHQYCEHSENETNTTNDNH